MRRMGTSCSWSRGGALSALTGVPSGGRHRGAAPPFWPPFRGLGLSVNLYPSAARGLYRGCDGNPTRGARWSSGARWRDYSGIRERAMRHGRRATRTRWGIGAGGEHVDAPGGDVRRGDGAAVCERGAAGEPGADDAVDDVDEDATDRGRRVHRGELRAANRRGADLQPGAERGGGSG